MRVPACTKATIEPPWSRATRSGSVANRIAVREAGSALLALIEYLHGEGVGDAEIVRLGQHEVSWRGAVYRAVAASPDRLVESTPRPT